MPVKYEDLTPELKAHVDRLAAEKVLYWEVHKAHAADSIKAQLDQLNAQGNAQIALYDGELAEMKRKITLAQWTRKIFADDAARIRQERFRQYVGLSPTDSFGTSAPRPDPQEQADTYAQLLALRDLRDKGRRARSRRKPLS